MGVPVVKDRQSGSPALLQRLIEDDESLLDGRDPAVEAMLIERLYQTSWATRYVPIPMLFGAFVIYQDLLTWWHIVSLTALYMGSTWYLDRQRDAYNDNPDPAVDWGLRFAIGCAGTGLTWGLLGWFGYQPGDFALQATLCVAWTGLATTTLNTRSMHLPSFYAFIAAMSAPFFARGFLFGEASTVIMAFFGAILLTAMCFCAQVNNRRERLSMALRLRNAALISEIDRARAAAETSFNQMEGGYRCLAADFAAMQRLTQQGFWAWEAESGQVVWSDETYRLLGLAAQSCPASLAAWLDCVHPDDRERVRLHYQRLRQGEPAGAVRFRLLDGTTKLQTIAEAVLKESGELQRIRGILRRDSVDA
jgi:PAS domain-containing protein